MKEENSKRCTLCERVGLKPLTKENLFNYYIPLHGVISYGALSFEVMNPMLVHSYLRKGSLMNVLLISSLSGAAVYMYGRPHLQTLSTFKRASYALLGGTLFSMGSVLAWAIFGSMLSKQNSLLATLAGLSSGAIVIKLSTDYFNDCEKLIVQK